MGFNMDDVMEALEIVKDCKDAELHIDTGEMKLSIYKGNVDSTRAPLDFSSPAVSAPPVAAALPAPVAPAAAEAPAPVAEPAVEEAPDAAETPADEEAPAPAETAAPEEEIDEEGLVPVTANVTSVFYRKPSPEEPPFVEVGDSVEPDSVVCLLEVMKCFRQVTAEAKGVIAKICVESNNLVEQGTTLFLIRPAD